MNATFKYADFSDVPAGPLDVVVFTDTGEHRCTIDAEARSTIR